MARMQVLPFPNGTYVLVIDEAHTLDADEYADLAADVDSLKEATGARGLLVFARTLDVV